MVTRGASSELGSWQAWHDEDRPLRLGVSSCLLGEQVRFDGGHKRDRFVADVLDPWVEWVSACPEKEIGMGVPRPTVRISDRDGEPRMIAPSTGEDFTERMNEYAETRVGALMDVDLDGYVLKKNSPSCGLMRIKVYKGEHPLHKKGVGLFAAVLTRRWPGLPVEEEGRLNDAPLRENFIERIFARNRWRTLVRRGPSRRALVAFHTAHKLLLLAHNEAAYRRLGRLVGEAGKTSDEELFRAYELEFQRALETRATVKKHCNVLQHAMGYLKRALPPAEKRELESAIEDYRGGLLPLIVPVTLLRFNLRKHGIDYLLGQV